MKVGNSPKTEDELLERCQQIEGMTFLQLAKKLSVNLPVVRTKRKGWIGQLIEIALGADCHTRPLPDFQDLSIELKTLPLNHLGKPAESTFVTSISLLNLSQMTWENSSVYKKLKRVLWVLVEGEPSIPYGARRIGAAKLWSPNNKQLALLKSDWQELTTQLLLGQLETIDARFGTALQIRPKAANGKVLCDAFNENGDKIKTLPRGFYLRTSFTSSVLEQSQMA
jgi:DNA mismatch repair protein MutH